MSEQSSKHGDPTLYESPVWLAPVRREAGGPIFDLCYDPEGGGVFLRRWEADNRRYQVEWLTTDDALHLASSYLISVRSRVDLSALVREALKADYIWTVARTEEHEGDTDVSYHRTYAGGKARAEALLEKARAEGAGGFYRTITITPVRIDD